VLACWGSYGDLFPYLAIATGLKALGHTPVVCSCPYYQGIVEQEGFEFRPLRPDVQPDNTALLERIMDPQRGSEVIIRELIVASLRQSYDDITAAVEGADLLLSHPITFAAPLVAAKRGLPWLASVLAPLSFFSLHDFPALPNAPQVVRLTRLTPWAGRALLAMARRITRRWVAPVVAMRAALGLPPAGDPLYEGQFSPYGNLALFSRALGDVQPDWPPRTQVTGFPFYNRAIPMPPELAAFLEAGEPPVVFTLGSAAVNTAGSFFDESARAVATLGVRAVLLVGPNPANRPLSLPPGTIAVDGAPHDQVFPRASAIVHQGGVGTTGQAMRSGRPELIVPFAHDQPDNAFRVQQLGIGRVVYPTRYKAERVRRELRALLDGRHYASRAEAVGHDVRAEGGAAAAVDAMLAVLARR
jgi:rhamnosyltransferase subunit B